jgi:hypothetical protein
MGATWYLGEPMERKKSHDLSLVAGVASSGAGGVGRVDVESSVVAIGSPT